MGWTLRRPLAIALMALMAVGGSACAQPRRPGSCAPVTRPGLIAASPPGRIVFDDGAERVPLLTACGAPLPERVRAAEGRRFILVVEDLRARQGSGVVFTLHLAEGEGGLFSGDEAVLGTLNFFAARPPEAPGAHRNMSYDITRTVRALAEAGRLQGGLVVMLAPSTPPSPEAQLSVGRVQLVAQ